MKMRRIAVFGVLIVLFYFAELHRLSYTQYAGSEQTMFSNDDLIQSTEAGAPGRRIGVLLLGTGGMLTLIRNRRKLRYSHGVMEAAILLFLLWVFFSVWWSDDVVLTIRRSTSFVLLWVAAFGFASNFDQRDGLRFLFAASMSFVLLGLGAELVLGTFSPGDPMYRFCGTIHPNHQAWNCCGLALAGIGLATTERRHRAVFLACSALGLAALVLTKSRTSAAALAVAVAVYIAITASRGWKLFGVWAGVSVCLAGLLFNVAGGQIENLLLLGRDPQEVATLTGRTDIWKVGISYFVDRPLRGYGFNAFETPRRIAEFERKAGWAAITLHSEYLDLLLGVGLVGLAAYLLIIVAAAMRTIRLFRAYRSKHYAVDLAIIVCVLCIMLLENIGRDPNILAFMFLVILSRRVLYRNGFHPPTGQLPTKALTAPQLEAFHSLLLPSSDGGALRDICSLQR